MKHRKSRYILLTGMAILFMISISSLQGYTAEETPTFMVFANEPMDGTFKKAYPEMEELYESDIQLVLITYDRVSKSGTHLVKVQIENANGEKIYDESKEVRIRNDRQKSYIYYIIPFDEAFKAKLMPVFVTIRFSLDGKAYQTKQIKYNSQNALRKNSNKVIILPFYSSTNTLFDYASKDDILNTFADAIGNEIKRIIPEVVVCDIAKSRVAQLKSKGCFKDQTCLKQLQDVYGKKIFVTGDISLAKTEEAEYTRVARCEVFAINTMTGDERKIISTYNMTSPGENEIDIMKKLISQLLYQNGLLSYIRALL